jgi:hypothetical protein
MGTEHDPDEKLKKAIRQVAGLARQQDGELLPEVSIKGGNGIVFCYYAPYKRFIKISRGTKAFIVDGDTISPDRVIIYTFDGHLVEIEKDELIFTGYD